MHHGIFVQSSTKAIIRSEKDVQRTFSITNRAMGMYTIWDMYAVVGVIVRALSFSLYYQLDVYFQHHAK